MRLLAWWLCGWLGLIVTQAISSRFTVAHLCPNVVWLIVAFVALKQPLVKTLAVALPLGHLLGQAAGAPFGLCETALVWVALGTALLGGNLAGQGATYFALVCGLGDIFMTLLQCALLAWSRHEIGFSSWATAMLVPQAMLTAFLGLVLFHPLSAFDRLLTPRVVRGLSWQ